jgi:hypothetical protein
MGASSTLEPFGFALWRLQGHVYAVFLRRVVQDTEGGTDAEWDRAGGWSNGCAEWMCQNGDQIPLRIKGALLKSPPFTDDFPIKTVDL